jgi:hypothetical protein
LSKDSISVFSAEKMDFPLFGTAMRCSAKKANAQFAALATYMPSLRFSLEDEEKREFSVERMSFMGGSSTVCDRIE